MKQLMTVVFKDCIL